VPRLSPSSSHYGAVMAVVEGDKMVGIQPYASDIDPSPIINSLPGMVHGNLRIPQPMVRAGWLADRHRSDGSRRGADAFVPVSWEMALDLVAGELERVRTEHGAESIYGGSYGWGSAGRLHNAPTLLRRMLGFTGGYTASVNNYSFGAALPLMPHIIGDFNRVLTDMTDWRTIASERDGKKPYQNLWIASRGPVSHGCIRLPSGHMSELRQIVPTDSPVLERVRTFRNLPGCYDVFDVRGDGSPAVMGVQYYVAYKCDTEHTPLRTYVANRRDPYYRWLYGTNAVLGPVGKVTLREAPVCRFVGRKAEEAQVLSNMPLYEAPFEPEAIQFFTVKRVPFDSDKGMELNRELRKVGAGHQLDRAKLLLD